MMADVATHQFSQIPFHHRPTTHSPGIGFGFGLSATSSNASWSSSNVHAPLSPWNVPFSHPQPANIRPAKRRLEPDDEDTRSRPSSDDTMDRSPTPERPKRAVPKRARISSAHPSSLKDSKDGREAKDTAHDDNDVDVGVLLASLPPETLLPLLMSLISSQPALKPSVLALIPRPTLQTASQAIAKSAKKLLDAFPYSTTGTPPPDYATTRSQDFSMAPSFGFGRPVHAFHTAHTPDTHHTAGMRDEYIISRLRPHIQELSTGTCLTPRRPTSFLHALTAHIYEQPPLTQSLLIPQLLPRLIQEWNAWIDRVDQVVNREGGMFGQEVVRSWERGLDEFASAKGNALQPLREKYTIPPPEQFCSISCLVVGAGQGGSTHMLARVAIMDYRGNTIYGTYVQPTIPVTDYRTTTTGITAEHLAPGNATPFNEVQQRVANLIKGKIIIGHALWHDLSVLGIPHPAVATRDVALYQPFRNALRATNTVGLPTLMWQLMRRRVQEGTLSCEENARAALDLYRSHANEWEQAISGGHWPANLPPMPGADPCFLAVPFILNALFLVRTPS
ncbi:hypothetical protein NM688_g4247 [Phlebia brevispora]|uniref:Uncharacterized protein n=1 Tax=Phlebia brevispora TaxID=194682 RepID=A0ACC1T360_9APHY|nr:hypothetical protein NM688_g4247 [Phlebia brevispora]